MNPEYLQLAQGVTKTLDGFRNIRNRPIVGGVFGSGRFVLSSLAHVKDGLDAVMFFVRHEPTLALIAQGSTKEDALGLARKVLQHFSPVEVDGYLASVQARRDAEAATEKKLIEDAEREAAAMRKASKVQSIPRRRQQIFAESDGQCHYCSTTLTLDGKWHIEHKMPRALGGGNEPGNLVASCVPCNMKKRDTTDVEFKAKRAGA